MDNTSGNLTTSRIQFGTKLSKDELFCALFKILTGLEPIPQNIMKWGLPNNVHYIIANGYTAYVAKTNPNPFENVLNYINYTLALAIVGNKIASTWAGTVKCDDTLQSGLKLTLVRTITETGGITQLKFANTRANGSTGDIVLLFNIKSLDAKDILTRTSIGDPKSLNIPVLVEIVDYTDPSVNGETYNIGELPLKALNKTGVTTLIKNRG